MKKARDTTLPAAHRISVQAELVFDYELRPATGDARELILLLHGYEETGRRILSKLGPALPADAVILAPNGPFPLPRRTEDGAYKLGCAWYLYNPATGTYVIDMRTALGFLQHGIEALGFAKLPKRVIGFSQGGYLAPFAACALSNVRQVIGLACEFLVDELPPGNAFAFRVDGVHGAKDDVVSSAEAKQTHAALASRGIKGELVVLEETGHVIDEAMRAAVGTLIRNG